MTTDLPLAGIARELRHIAAIRLSDQHTIELVSQRLARLADELEPPRPRPFQIGDIVKEAQDLATVIGVSDDMVWLQHLSNAVVRWDCLAADCTLITAVDE